METSSTNNQAERQWIIRLLFNNLNSDYWNGKEAGLIADAILARYTNRAAPAWQLISTVPKDGKTKVDLLYPEPIGRVVDCTWNLNWGVERGLHWIWHGRTAEFITAQPTHWMLSPAMPAHERGQMPRRTEQ